MMAQRWKPRECTYLSSTTMATTVLHVDQRLISLQHVVETIQGLLANQERACNETLEQHKADTAKTLAMLSNVTVRRQPPSQTPLRIGYRYSPTTIALSASWRPRL